MKKRLVIIIILIFLMSFISAKISIDSEPQDVYNLGDNLYITISTTPSSNYGNLNVNLFCNNKTINLLKWPSQFFGEQTNYPLPVKKLTKKDLEIDNIDDIVGTCQVIASLGEEKDSTKSFIVTKNVLVTPRLNKTNYNPKEHITLYVDALKENNYPLEGFIEVTGTANFKKAISGGSVSETFVMPETTEPSEYKLNILVYDKSEEGEILNQGYSSIKFAINQVPSHIQTSLSQLEVDPGNNISFALDLFDQSGKLMEGAISVSVISPTNEETKLVVNSGTTGNLNFQANSTPGKWKIISSFKDISDTKEFALNAIQKAEFEILEDSSMLLVKNVGNCIYNKTIEIKIGENIQKIEKIAIGIGEERKFSIKAPKGEYDIKINDGNSNVEKRLLLTGKAISVKEASNFDVFSQYPIIWIFMIILLALVAIFSLIKFKKTSKLKDKVRKFNPELDAPKPLPLKTGKAESSLVLKGEKSNSSIIIVKLNYAGLRDTAREELEKMLEIAKQNKGVIEYKEDHVIIIFNPLITRSNSNESIAVRTGFDIFKRLTEYNRKFATAIPFNIGIHSGNLISSVENGRLKYTSIENTIILARKISSLSTGKMLVSDSIRNKIVRDIKAEKAGVVGKHNIFSVEKISDKEANQQKLADILKRMK
ncbi:MAG: hypothetical protein ACOYT4_02570 [Nanoarchaeota archaeon]